LLEVPTAVLWLRLALLSSRHAQASLHFILAP
jgi:hypothetical protein